MKLSSKFPILFYLLLSFQFSEAQDISLQTSPDTDQSNNIRNYLMKVAAEISDYALSDIQTLADWKMIRSKRYNEFLESMGLNYMPVNDRRPDLNVHITGIIKQKGYRIEKLYYESLPGLYVTANLYIPDRIRKPVPAILYVCGHGQNQKVYYQEYPRKYAQLGFVCMLIETIQLGEVRGEHHGCYYRGWFNWYSRGYTPAGVELWNAIRAIDLLVERSEVDPDRIGVTGTSGGGAQSWFIAAADPRIRAVAASAGATTLKAHILTRSVDHHCDCMMPINTFCRDFKDIGALIAPRPLLIIQNDRDPLNQIEGVRELYTDIRKIYTLYGLPRDIDLAEAPGGHSSVPASREKTFAFFLKHLMGKQMSLAEIGDTDRSPEAQLTLEELTVYGDKLPENNRTKTIQDSFIQLAKAPRIKNKDHLFAYRDSVMDFLKNKTFYHFPEVRCPLDPKIIFRTSDNDKYGNNVYSFVPEEGWRLKVDIHWRNNPDNSHPLMIVLRNPDEERNESARFIEGFSSEWNIAYLEVRGVGESGWSQDLQWHIRRASAWTGRTIASMRVYDVLRCIEFCRTIQGVDPGKIGIAGRDEMGVVALYAALLDGDCHTVLLQNPPETQDLASRPDGRGAATEMLNCLRITDVYQLPALIPSTGIIFKENIPDFYLWSENLRKELGFEKFTVLE
jgi:cephalosporin-C deacetylase-like acetyl esterase